MTRLHIIIGFALAVGWPTLGPAQPQVPTIDADTAPATATAALPPPVNRVSPRAAPLTSKERRAVNLANEWKGRRDMPVRGEDGSVTFLFGATLPSVICSPLYVCDIRLQPGEVINDIHAGDAVRWKITPATSGSGAHTTTHIVVKPTDAGLSTNLVVTTDRRTYTIKLISTRNEWMPAVAFDYSEDVQTQWAAYAAAQPRDRAASVLSTGQHLATLDFGFKLSGDSPRWRPLRVYTDGVKTYLQFPQVIKNGEAPALVALSPEDNEQLVNYRMVGDRYVVDKVLDHAALISGVGPEQVKVEITREGGSD